MPFIVDTGIPFGNACDISVGIGGQITEVSFAPDPRGSPECMWFCMRIISRQQPAPSKLRLLFKNPQNILGGSRPLNIRPVMRYGSQSWQRLEAGELCERADGRVDLAWTVDAPADHLDLAFCYPYGRDELFTLLCHARGYFRCDSIGVSQGGRPLLRLANDYGQPASARPGLYLIARQHAGETPGSWVLDGFLRHLAALGEAGPMVWAVPLANIDAIENGDYGKDNYPYDLNRAWGRPPMRHETLVLQQDIERWKKRCRPVLAIDFHAPGASEVDGVYACVPDSQHYPEIYREACPWSALCREALAEYAAPVFERMPNHPSRWESPYFTQYLWEQHRLCGLALEIPYALANGHILTRESYHEAGARLAAAVVKRL